MSTKLFLKLLTFLLLTSCLKPGHHSTLPQPSLEKISYFHYPLNSTSHPFQYRLTYSFEDGKPYRQIELDSLGKVLTEYLYTYDANSNHIGAMYREREDKEYKLERIRYENDRTKITERIDLAGRVISTSVENLNQEGKPYKATFEGEQTNGYESFSYTVKGFEKRIFFTDANGSVLDDRSFRYDSISPLEEWVQREKIIKGTITEIQVREIHYGNNFTTEDNLFYPAVVSTGEFSENAISFTRDEQTLFLTRTEDWEYQSGFISRKEKGILTNVRPIAELDSIYNGAISPMGDKIIYTVKQDGEERAYLVEKKDGQWAAPIILTIEANLRVGYFFWLTDEELFFYVQENNGDIVKGRLENYHLTITDHLEVLNSDLGTEFSPFVDIAEGFIIFTRYVEGDLAQQGFFISYHLGDAAPNKWSPPKKLSMLPYGWNAYIINNKSQFIYSNGDDILSVPIETLKLTVEH